MGKLRIGRLLVISFGAIVLILVALGILGTARLNQSGAALKDITLKQEVKVSLTNRIRLTATSVLLEVENIVLAPTTAQSDAATARLNADSAEILADYDKLKAIGLDPTETKSVEEALVLRQRFRDSFARALQMLGEGSRESAVPLLFDETLPALQVYREKLQSIIDYQEKNTAASRDAAIAGSSSAQYWMVGSTLLGAALAVLACYLVQRSVTTPINEALELTRAVAQGDLTGQSHFDPESDNEANRMLQALDQMMVRLREIVGEVRLSSDTIVTASAEIAGGSMDLSSRTEHQASALEETASSMEQLTSSVRDNASNAGRADELAAKATRIAGDGGTVIGQVVETMGHIDASARKIVDIIAVIDGIAFHTNILALNAAVEAARAGEQGRGFAVVASEVRNLAQRSATAAREVKALIGHSVETVDAGARLVDEAGATMDGIVSAVKQVADIMTEISAASTEQSSGIAQINQSIVQIDDVTQQNAALVEQAAAAAQSMREQADLLAQAVSVFKLAGQPAPRAAPPRVAPRAVAAVVKASAAKAAARPQASARPAPKRVTTSAASGSADWEEF